MQTKVPVSKSAQTGASKNLIDQPENNTTLWIGHLPSDPADHYGGQTFTCRDTGNIDHIQLFASAVHSPGQLRLTLHEFDNPTQSWGQPIGDATVSVNIGDGGQWVDFALPGVRLSGEQTYGFKLSANDAVVGLGEAVTGNQSPFNGYEWQADSKGGKGCYFSYFSLAFKVKMS